MPRRGDSGKTLTERGQKVLTQCGVRGVQHPRMLTGKAEETVGGHCWGFERGGFERWRIRVLLGPRERNQKSGRWRQNVSHSKGAWEKIIIKF